MGSPNFGSIPKTVYSWSLIQGPNDITQNISHTTHLLWHLPACNLNLNITSYVSILVYKYQKRLRVSVLTAPVAAVVLGSGRTPEARVPSLPYLQESLPVSSRTRLGFPGPYSASPSPSSPRSMDSFLVPATPPEARLLRLIFLVFKSKFFYSLLKSAANAVVKRMSAVVAIAHALLVSIKSLSVKFMLFEHSFGKLKYD